MWEKHSPYPSIHATSSIVILAFTTKFVNSQQICYQIRHFSLLVITTIIVTQTEHFRGILFFVLVFVLHTEKDPRAHFFTFLNNNALNTSNPKYSNMTIFLPETSTHQYLLIIWRIFQIWSLVSCTSWASQFVPTAHTHNRNFTPFLFRVWNSQDE